MDTLRKEHFKKLLDIQKEKEEIAIEHMNNDSLNISAKITTGELSSYDNHPADIGTEVFMVEHAMGLKAMHEDSIKKVEDAIKRLDSEEFGICKECNLKIDEERLEILPEAKLCINCARKEDENTKLMMTAIKSRKPGHDEITTSYGTKPIKDPLSHNDGGKDILNELMKFGSAEVPSEEGNYKDFNEFYNTKMSEDGIVEDVDKISNEDYIAQLPD
jgi:RNA polymerase-binding transcription factor DksA